MDNWENLDKTKKKEKLINSLLKYKSNKDVKAISEVIPIFKIVKDSFDQEEIQDLLTELYNIIRSTGESNYPLAFLPFIHYIEDPLVISKATCYSIELHPIINGNNLSGYYSMFSALEQMNSDQSKIAYIFNGIISFGDKRISPKAIEYWNTMSFDNRVNAFSLLTYFPYHGLIQLILDIMVVENEPKPFEAAFSQFVYIMKGPFFNEIRDIEWNFPMHARPTDTTNDMVFIDSWDLQTYYEKWVKNKLNKCRSKLGDELTNVIETMWLE